MTPIIHSVHSSLENFSRVSNTDERIRSLVLHAQHQCTLEALSGKEAPAALSDWQEHSARFLIACYKGIQGDLQHRLRKKMNEKIRELCGSDIPFAQVTPLRIFLVRGGCNLTLLSVTNDLPETFFVKLPSKTTPGESSSILVTRDHLERLLSFFCYHLELAASDASHFAPAEEALSFLEKSFQSLPRPSFNLYLKQYDLILSLLKICRAALNHKENYLPLLFRPVSLPAFHPRVIRCFYDGFSSYAGKRIFSFLENFDATLTACRPLIKADLEKKEKRGLFRELRDVYLDPVEKLLLKITHYCQRLDGSTFQTALKEYFSHPAQKIPIERLLHELDRLISAEEELDKAYRQFSESSDEVLQRASQELASTSWPFPFHPLSSLHSFHQALFSHSLLCLMLFKSRSLRAMKAYLEAVLEKRMKLSSENFFLKNATKAGQSIFITPFHLLCHDLKKQIRHFYESAPADLKPHVFSFFERLSPFQSCFLDLAFFLKADFDDKYSKFDEEKAAQKLYGYIYGLKNALDFLQKDQTSPEVLQPLNELTRFFYCIKEALIPCNEGAFSLEPFYHLFLPLGNSLNLSEKELAFFQETLELIFWSLQNWTAVPLSPFPYESHPFFLALPSATQDFFEGYLKKIERNAAKCRLLLLEVEEKLKPFNPITKANLVPLASLLKEYEKKITSQGMEDLIEEFLKKCQRAFLKLPEDKRRELKQDQNDWNFNLRDAYFQEDAVFYFDVWYPSAPLIDHATCEELISKVPQESATAAPRSSPILFEQESAELSQESPPSLETPLFSSSTKKILPSDVLKQLQTLLFREGKTASEQLLHLSDYASILNTLLPALESSDAFSFAALDALFFYSALTVEQLLKFFLLKEGLKPEDQPMLFSHRIDELLTRLKERDSALWQELLSKKEQQTLISMGHLIVHESRHLFNVHTKIAELLKESAFLSSRLHLSEHIEEKGPSPELLKERASLSSRLHLSESIEEKGPLPELTGLKRTDAASSPLNSGLSTQLGSLRLKARSLFHSLFFSLHKILNAYSFPLYDAQEGLTASDQVRSHKELPSQLVKDDEGILLGAAGQTSLYLPALDGTFTEPGSSHFPHETPALFPEEKTARSLQELDASFRRIQKLSLFLGCREADLEPAKRLGSLSEYKSRRRLIQTSHEASRYHTLALKELAHFPYDPLLVYPKTMIALNKCSLLLENSLKSLLAFYDIPNSNATDHILQEHDKTTDRPIEHTHRLHALFSLLKPRLPPHTLAPEDEELLKTLNDFIGQTGRYLFAAADNDALKPSLKNLATLTQWLPDARHGFYSREAKERLASLFSSPESTWPLAIEKEILSLRHQLFTSFIHRALQLSQRLFHHHETLLFNAKERLSNSPFSPVVK